MRTPRRGLTVIELVLILLVIGAIIFFLLRARGRDDAAAGAALDSTGASAGASPVAAPAPPGAGSALAARLALSQAVDSTARAGDTLTLRVRATTATGAGVANAIVHLAAEGGGRVLPDSVTTDDLGEAEVRWILGDSSPQSLRATVPGSSAEPLETRVRIVAGGGQ